MLLETEDLWETLLLEDEPDVEGEVVSTSSSTGRKPLILDRAEPRRCERVAEPYPNLRLAVPLRSSPNVMSGVAARVGTGVARLATSSSGRNRARLRLTVACALRTAAVVTRPGLIGGNPTVVLVRHPLRHRTPTLVIGSLATLAACPGPAHSIELAVEKRTVGIAGLRRCVADMAARCLDTRFEVDHGGRAVMPVDRGVRTRMPSRVTMTHCDD